MTIAAALSALMAHDWAAPNSAPVNGVSPTHTEKHGDRLISMPISQYYQQHEAVDGESLFI